MLTKVRSHIGIFNSNKCLYGDGDVVFQINDKEITLCIYSLPNADIISDVRISNIKFVVNNDKSDFYEFIHSIKVVGVNNLIIENCTFMDFYGDAICLSSYGDNENTGERSKNQKVKIYGNRIYGPSHNNRNGISVINGCDVIIENNKIVETSSSKMPGGIDVEANNSAYTIKNINIINNEIINCKGAVGAISVVANKNNAPANDIKIKNNYIKESKIGIRVLVDNENSTDQFEIMDNYLEDCSVPLQFDGKGKTRDWVVKNNWFSGGKIRNTLKIENIVSDIK